MPELPEVETVRRGVAPWLTGRCITDIQIDQPKLRWPVPEQLPEILTGQTIRAVGRRAKYLLWHFDEGSLILHLGMSGRFRKELANAERQKHDHVSFRFDDGYLLRYNDARRFGSIHWQPGDVAQHPLLASLGPEPLSDLFDAQRLYDLSRRRSVAVKNFIMDSAVVVGVGNIYASEALHLAGIHPARSAGKISLPRYQRLTDAIKQTLHDAIEQGGTTLRDFFNSEGTPGYFAQRLAVYGRAGESCQTCAGTIQQLKIGQRSSFFCTNCQR